MKLEDAQKIIDAKIGSIVSVDGVPIPVVGRFSERYFPNGMNYHDEHCLSLDGRQEVGIYPVGDGLDVWYARFSRTLPMSSYDRVRNSLGNDIEVGKIKRLSEEGSVSPAYHDYVFGNRMGVNVFLALNPDGTSFEVWVNYTPREVKDAGFQQKPWGWIKGIDKNKEELVIAPGKSTSLDANPINAQGLCGHPGEVWERVKHLGNLYGHGSSSLIYRVLEGDRIVDRVYSQGSDFFSVSPSGVGEDKPGYWSNLENHSNKPIRLEISWKESSPKRIRTAVSRSRTSCA